MKHIKTMLVPAPVDTYHIDPSQPLEAVEKQLDGIWEAFRFKVLNDIMMNDFPYGCGDEEYHERMTQDKNIIRDFESYNSLVIIQKTKGNMEQIIARQQTISNNRSAGQRRRRAREREQREQRELLMQKWEAIQK